MPDSDLDDPVAAALVGESAYERLRVTRHAFFKQPLHRKLQLQSALLFGLALVLPLVAVFPAEVRALLPGEGVLTAAAPKVMLLGLVGGGIVLVGGLTLTAIGIARVRLEPRMTEQQADTLLNLEELASLLGIATGGLGIVLTIGFTAIGLGGLEAVQAYVETVGRSPFAPGGVEWLSVTSIATFAFVGGVALFTAGQYLRIELMVRVGNAVTGLQE